MPSLATIPTDYFEVRLGSIFLAPYKTKAEMVLKLEIHFV